MDIGMKKLIDIFEQNIKGKSPDLSGRNQRHDGRGGHWLEEQFGITANSSNSPDIFGYELKNETTSKTSFGDWSANYYIYKDSFYSSIFKGKKKDKQDTFVQIFGKPNAKKNNRYSWSGTPCPTINGYNDFGQKLEVDANKDILAVYSYSKDQRINKANIVPQLLQKDNLIIARWYGKKSPSSRKSDQCLKEKLELKFNDMGWFTCKKNSNDVYERICFGKPIDFDTWIDLVEKGIVFFDSGMYQENQRPYSQWRAYNSFWDSLIFWDSSKQS